MPGYFDYSLITRIQQANDIVDVIAEHLRLEKKGKELVGLCPFHADHRPSLYVNPEKQIFKCFACGAGGDVLKFVQMRENLSFPQAVERLARRASIPLDPSWNKKKNRHQTENDQLDPAALSRINDWAMKLWIQNLWHSEKGAAAREYLKERKITEDTARHWKLGLALDAWDDISARTGTTGKLSSKMLIEAGLAVQKETGGCYDKFRNRLIFPILDVGGRVIGFGGRTLGGDSAKYMNSPATALFDKGRCLYGLHQARHAIVETGTAVVMEGYTDVLMAHQYGIGNAVASLGTSFTAGHAHLLRRFAKQIILLFDSDTAGRAAAERALEVCLAEKIDIRMAFLPEGKDPCDFLLQSGADRFQQVLQDSKDVMEYAWQRLCEQIETGQTLTDRTEAMKQFLRHVAAGLSAGKVDRISKTLLLTRLSDLLGLSAGRIEKELINFTKKSSFSASPRQIESPIRNYIIEAQREVLEVLLNEPGLLAEHSGEITVEIFSDPVCREIAEVLLDFLNQGIEPAPAQLCGRIESPAVTQQILELQQNGAMRANFRNRLRQAVDVLQEDIQRQEMKKVKERLNENDGESLRKIHEILKNQKGNLRSGLLKP